MLYIDSATCACVSDDSSLMSVGFNESQLRVFSLTPEKLRSMKPADDLNVIDKEAGASGMSPRVDTLSMHKETYNLVMCHMEIFDVLVQTNSISTGLIICELSV